MCLRQHQQRRKSRKVPRSQRLPTRVPLPREQARFVSAIIAMSLQCSYNAFFQLSINIESQTIVTLIAKRLEEERMKEKDRAKEAEKKAAEKKEAEKKEADRKKAEDKKAKEAKAKEKEERAEDKKAKEAKAKEKAT